MASPARARNHSLAAIACDTAWTVSKLDYIRSAYAAGAGIADPMKELQDLAVPRNRLARFDRWTGWLTPPRARLVHRTTFALAIVIAIGMATWLGHSLISPVNAQDVTYFRIATGGPGSQSFEIAGDISKAISNPVTTDDCDPGDSCGVPGVIGMAQTTSGAVESLRLLRDGQVDGAIVQADMAALAVAGKGPFKSAGPDATLRAIATVGDTALQVIVPAKSNLHSFSDLRGHRLAISAIEADGTISANQALIQLGIADKKTRLIPMSLSDAIAQFVAGKVDALVIMDRSNLPDVMKIGDHMSVRLLSVSDADLMKIGKDRRDLILAHLPVGTDGSPEPVDTLIVPILFVVSVQTDNTVAFDLARTLVVPKRGAKTTANPAASSPDAHIESTVIPLHPGVQHLLDTTN